MKKYLILLFLPSFVHAYQTTFNPFTGSPDYVGVSSANIPAGSNQYIQNTLTPTTTTQTASVNTLSANVFVSTPLVIGTSTIAAAYASAWTNPMNLNTARIYPNSIVISSGGVQELLVCGGENTSGYTLNTCEICNPVTNVCSFTGNMPIDEQGGQEQLLPNGNPILMGGSQVDPTFTILAISSVSIYNVAGGTWTSMPNMIEPVLSPGSVYYSSGTPGIMVVGGADNDPNQIRLSTAQFYNINGNYWTILPNMCSKVAHTNPVVMGSSVVVAGGSVPPNTSTTTVCAFNGLVWNRIGDMGTARQRHMLTVLPNGNVLAAFGRLTNSADTNSAEIMSSTTYVWTSTSTGITVREAFPYVTLPNGDPAAIGGDTPYQTAYAEYLDVNNTGNWVALPTLLQVTDATTDASQPGLMTSNGNLYVAGGATTGGTYTTQVEELNYNQAYQNGLVFSGPWTVGGSQGTSGQALVSQGSGVSPQWSTTLGASNESVLITSNTIMSGTTFYQNGPDNIGNTVNLTGVLNSTAIFVSSAALYTTEYQGPSYTSISTVSWESGSIQDITLTANTTINFTPPHHSMFLHLNILTGSGGYTVSWPSGTEWVNQGSAPTITTTASRLDVIVCEYREVNGHYLCESDQNFTP